jgi:hypothetical protein
MKKFIILLLILLSSKICAQTIKSYDTNEWYDNAYNQVKPIKKNNSIYALLQPADLGYGLRYDRIFKNLGVYISGSYGNYNLPNGDYIKDHFKIASGLLMYSPCFVEDAFISCGVSYHHYGEYYFSSGVIPNFTLSPVSCELGVGTRLGLISVAFRMDVLKYESSIEVGLNF